MKILLLNYLKIIFINNSASSWGGAIYAQNPSFSLSGETFCWRIGHTWVEQLLLTELSMLAFMELKLLGMKQTLQQAEKEAFFTWEQERVLVSL